MLKFQTIKDLAGLGLDPLNASCRHQQREQLLAVISGVPEPDIYAMFLEQDHRAVIRITKPMLGFKAFQSAKRVIAGIELMHMIRKGQLINGCGCGCGKASFADQYYALAK